MASRSPKTAVSEMDKLLAQADVFQMPKAGDLIEGTVISLAHNEVLLNINGYAVGIIRGPELFDESSEYSSLKTGDIAEATVLELENENGQLEMSFRFAGHQKAWDELDRLSDESEMVDAHVLEANKGGLIIRVNKIPGFLPVSQLTPEHYPRVEGGDRNKILEHLTQFVGTPLKVKVIDVNEPEEKLIVSERAAWEEKQKDVLESYNINDIIKGKITGVVDFGAFVEFGEGLEGLVHISELAWQRIDNPRDHVKVGTDVEAQIISIEGSKISLSMKKLIDDPWKHVNEKYTVGQIIEGLVLKVNPFGAFVELDRDIHGLAHISEFSDKLVNNPADIVTPGKEYKFKIISIDPNHHRLGLSLKALKKDSGKDSSKEAPKEEAKADEKESTPEKKEEKPKEEKTAKETEVKSEK